MEVYGSKPFRELCKNDPKAALHLSFAADIRAGAQFGADEYLCKNMDWPRTMKHPLFKGLFTELCTLWKDALKGLKIVRHPSFNQSVVITDKM